MTDKIDAIEFEEMLMTLLYANENALAAAVWWHHPEFHKRFKKDQLKEIIYYFVRGILIKEKENKNDENNNTPGTGKNNREQRT